MEVEDSEHFGSRALIVSPPTDPGIGLIARANRSGSTELLCFSDELERIATTYSRERGIESLRIRVAPFFELPFGDEELGVIYANCFFDYCEEGDYPLILDEMWRVLKRNGSLFAVYMGFPDGVAAKGWAWALRRLRFPFRGCHPTSMKPYLERHGFLVEKDVSLKRLGFPLRYNHARKRERRE
jgi:ubiquinone/menaquinone biosynthesis C-methylase UbiE